MSDLILEVQTPLGFSVSCTRSYWEFIVTQKHLFLRGRKSGFGKSWKTPMRYGGAGRIPQCTSSIGAAGPAGSARLPGGKGKQVF